MNVTLASLLSNSIRVKKTDLKTVLAFLAGTHTRFPLKTSKNGLKSIRLIGVFENSNGVFSEQFAFQKGNNLSSIGNNLSSIAS